MKELLRWISEYVGKIACKLKCKHERAERKKGAFTKKANEERFKE